MINTFIIDGNNMAYRARYSYNLSYRGRDTSVTYGVLSMLRSLIKKYRPHSLVMCWDGGVPFFRRELVPTYKSNRDRSEDVTYDEFLMQMDELRDILPYFGILNLYRRGIEADDLMYHCSRLLEADSIVLVTGDEDLVQAINGNVSVLKPVKNGYTDIGDYNFTNVLGVNISQYLQYKVLQGDGSDNIPGIPGVGPITAKRIVNGERNIPDAIKAKLNQFISSGAHNKHLQCVDLSHDRCGARDTILDVEYTRYSGLKAKAWCIDNGFVSLYSDEPLGVTFGKLHKPLIEPDPALKVPVIWDYYRGL